MNTITPPIVDKYTLEQQSTNNFNKELGQEDFLELMMAQLKHQDPMEPMDNGEFLGQMAQFSTVTGIDEMKQSMEGLSASYAAGQTLQSTQLVGQEVLVESATLELNDTGQTEGAFELDVGSGDVRMDVANSAGTIIRQIELGEHAAGRHTFQWDGMDSNGKRVPQGQYSVQISAQRDDEYVSATVLTTRVVDSVEFGNGTDTILNTRQGDILTLEDIRQIRQRAGADTDSSDN
ncbi:MAG: flagellar hook assembly protein FlgD [Granulosicoccus sp.]